MISKDTQRIGKSDEEMVTSLDCKSIGFPVSKNFIVK